MHKNPGRVFEKNTPCKGPVYVEVLTRFYGRFVVEVRQLNSIKVPSLGPPFFSFVDSASLWRAEP